MAPNPQIMAAVEQLGYRVTNGDVATRAGLHLDIARQGLLALAADAGGHLQVTDTGEVIYVFREDFRQVLRRKFIQIQLWEWANKIWAAIFYLIRISFGIVLILSIGLVYLAIFLITIASIFNDNNSSDSGGGISFDGSFFTIFDWGPYSSSTDPVSTGDRRTSRTRKPEQELNFLEAVFSFLFGDGNPNADLEQKRWKYIGRAINRHRGAVIAEQIAPYLDDIGMGFDREYENYMLPVLTKFNGLPEVSPKGQLVYHFPDLQTTARSAPDREIKLPLSLQEKTWRFSRATGTQIGWSIGLGIANLVGVIILSGLLAQGSVVASGGLVGFVSSIITILFLYAAGFITIPIGRYCWIQWQNQHVRQRNQERRQRVALLSAANEEIQEKLDYARQFAKQHTIEQGDIVYTTEEDALDQEFQRLEPSD